MQDVSSFNIITLNIFFSSNKYSNWKFKGYIIKLQKWRDK